jgi:hypothetical protein
VSRKQRKKQAILWVQLSDPDYSVVGNLDLHEVGFLRKGKMVYHEPFWNGEIEGRLSYTAARARVEAWAEANGYEIVDVVRKK